MSKVLNEWKGFRLKPVRSTAALMNGYRTFPEMLDRLIPPDRNLGHERAWHDGNGHSHVQAAILGPSLSIPIRNNRLTLGTWQQVVVINHDNRARQREIEVTVVGY